MRSLNVQSRRFAIRDGFTISRGTRTHAEVVEVTLTEHGATGHGECTPYARYGETVESVVDQICGLRDRLEAGLDVTQLSQLISPGAARNAIDCALWDLQCKRTGQAIHDLLSLPAPRPLSTAFTLSLGDPNTMAEQAWANRHRPLLKVKLGGDGDPDRMHAVMGHCGDAQVIVDANEAWEPANLWEWLDLAAELGIAMVEQPLPAENDTVLNERDRPLPVCADESCHDQASLSKLVGRYDLVNIKLDKTGGLTEALATKQKAKELGFGIFIGCMMGSSLAMAPAFFLANEADYVDLDAPLLLSEDREPPLAFTDSTIQPPDADLWG
ncbi:MAG: N-acetyl-D-Glu racemase DgcA [Pseudomonadota bacterium]